MEVTKAEFFDTIRSFKQIPFIQSEEWFKGYFKDNTNCVFFLNEKKNIGCWGLVLKKPLFGTLLRIEGYCTDEGSTFKDAFDFFKTLALSNYDLVEYVDLFPYDPYFEVSIRQAGYKRAIGHTLCPMTMIVDLEQLPKPHRNWRRNVKKSFEAGNVFECTEPPTENDIKDFIELYRAYTLRKSLPYTLSVDQLRPIVSSGAFKMFFIKNAQGKRLNARLMYVHDELAYDVIAANTDDALVSGAGYHIQQAAFEYLAARGVKKFDYGRISPSDDKMNDIYVYKSYSGGTPIAYNGEWFWTKRLWLAFAMSFYRFVKGKARLY